MKYLILGLGRATRTIMNSGYLDMSQIAGFIDRDASTYVHSGGQIHIRLRMPWHT